MWYYVLILAFVIYILLQFIPNDGPPGVPWYGVITFFNNPNKAVHQYIQKYGSIFTLPFPLSRRPWYFVLDEPLVAEFLKAGPEKLSFIEALKDIIPGTVGDRDTFNEINFDEQKKLMRGALWKGSQNLPSLYLEWMKETCLETIKPGEIDLFKFTSHILMLVSMRVVFGKKLTDSLSDITILMGEAHLASIHPLTIIFPWLPFGPPRMTREVRKKVDKIIYNYVSDVISEKEALEPDTYLAYLMEHRFIDEKRPKVDVIASHIINVILPSQITTTSTSAWTIYNLCKHPDLVQRIREQEGVDIYENIIQDLLFESASRYTNLFLFRKVVEPYRLGKYLVPKDSYIATMPNYLMNSDKDIIWDPLNPKTNTIGWSPFGSALHPCLGQHLVRYQYNALFESLYLNFDVELLNDYDHFTWGTTTASPMPNRPLIARITRRKQD